jgi:hypothetical protein
VSTVVDTALGYMVGAGAALAVGLAMVQLRLLGQ